MQARYNMTARTQSSTDNGQRTPLLETSPAFSRSPIPLYHRLRMLLRERILAGIYPPGSALPSEHELMRSFDISRITAKRALDELLAEGLVDRSRGRGTIVRPNVLAHPFISADINDLMKSLNEIGRTTSVKVIEFGYQAASPRVASELGIDPGTTIQRAVRVRYLDEVPFSHSSSHLIEHV
ncbi:MAG: GntR family transcriptional regulator, partial [Pirellulales bacterium]